MGDDTVTVYRRVALTGGRLQESEYMAVRIVYDVRSPQQAVRMAGLIAALVCLVVLAVTLAFSARLFDRRVVRRIDRLNTALARIARGDYDSPVSPVGEDELSEMAHHVDEMRRRLQSRDREVREARDRLEERVRERTAALARSNEELAAARDEARAVTRLKDTFISLVSHDLRSPLNGIQGMIALLRNPGEYPMDEDERREVYAKVDRSLSALIGFIQTLLDVSRLQTGKLRLRKRPVDLSGLVSEAVAGIRPRAAEKGVTVTEQVEEGVRILADRGLIQGVFNNLLGNAVKFSPRGGKVTVYSPAGAGTIVAVRDEGGGVDPAFLSDLFRHEVKTVAAGTGGEVGTGLGLPYGADLMRLHGGSLTVESEPGKGATFYAAFPEVRRTVLVVDDQEAHQAMMREALTGIPHLGIVEAADGREALEVLADFTPDLVITDLLMPVMDGYDLIDEIRRTHRLDAIPVLVATSLACQAGDEADEARRRCAERGVEVVIPKPVERDQLRQRVRELLGMGPGRGASSGVAAR